jgi:hypothetical protein
MTFLISLLMYLGVIGSADQVTSENVQQYEQQYLTESNTDAYFRQMDPTELDEL